MRWQLDKKRLPTGCRVRLSKRAVVDLPVLFKSMEEAEVPAAYTDQLEEIYFTVLRGNRLDEKVADYVFKETTEIRGPRPRIRLSFANMNLPRNLAHELGHHVDVLEDLSTLIVIHDEWERHRDRKLELIEDGYEKKAVIEYVACGFEEFYFGDRKTLKKRFPTLYEVVSDCHRKYSEK